MSLIHSKSPFSSLLAISQYILLITLHVILIATNILEEPKIAIGPTMPTALVSAVPVASTPVGPGNFLSVVLSSIKAFIITFISSLCLFLTKSCCTLCSFSSPSPVEVGLTSRFEVGSSPATVLDPMSEVAAFFT